jgi:hypothetical protein
MQFEIAFGNLLHDIGILWILVQRMQIQMQRVLVSVVIKIDISLLYPIVKQSADVRALGPSQNRKQKQ